MQSYYQRKEVAMRMSLRGTKLNYPPHFHASLEVVYIRRGHSTVLVGQTEYRLAPDDLLILFPHQIHAYRDDEALERVLLFIPLDTIPAFRDYVCAVLPDCPVVHDAAARYPRLIALFEDIHHARYGKIAHAETVLSAYLTAFVGLALPAFTLTPTAVCTTETVHTILHYCATHYREPLTVTALADALYMSRNAVSAIFSRQLHTGFNDYLNSLRIEEACHLLRTTKGTITEISAAVGFETIRTFNRAFARLQGCTPHEYRDAHTAKTDGQAGELSDARG